MSEQLLVSYVTQLSHDLESVAPSADSSGSYTIVVGSNLAITLHALNPIGFYFSSNIDTLPVTNLEDFYALIMHANLFGIGTGEGVIGLGKDGKMLTFTHISPYQLNYVEFKERVEDCVNYVDLWQKKTQDVKNNVSK